MSRKLKFRIITTIFFVTLAVGGNAVYNALFVTPDVKLAAAHLDSSNAPAAITGTAANKATAVALKKYPGSTVQRVQELRNGTYAVHLTNGNSTRHVFENQHFQIIGVA